MTDGTKKPSTPRVTLSSGLNCAVEKEPDGSLILHVRVDPNTAKRHLSRCAGRQDPADYFWQDVLRPALEGAVW